MPGRPGCVAVLRTATRALVALVSPEAVDAAELICSELGGNAVRRSRSGEPGQTMTLRVHDEGHEFLVQVMSKEWGVDYGTDGSTTVWSRLNISGEGSP